MTGTMGMTAWSRVDCGGTGRFSGVESHLHKPKLDIVVIVRSDVLVKQESSMNVCLPRQFPADWPHSWRSDSPVFALQCEEGSDLGERLGGVGAVVDRELPR